MNVLRSQESGDRGQNERTGLTKGLATLMVSEANRVPSGRGIECAGVPFGSAI
jgi:hypothetical protein